MLNQRQRNIRVQEILKHEKTYRIFLNFCQLYRNEENIVFQKNVEEFKTKIGYTKIYKAHEILKTFLERDSPFEINVEEMERRKIKRTIISAMKGEWNKENVDLDINSNIFDRLVKVTLSNIQETFKIFQMTADFETCLTILNEDKFKDLMIERYNILEIKKKQTQNNEFNYEKLQEYKFPPKPEEEQKHRFIFQKILNKIHAKLFVETYISTGEIDDKELTRCFNHYDTSNDGSLQEKEFEPLIKNFVNVFCNVIEDDLKKNESQFSKVNYEKQKKIWKSTSFQKEQAVLMDTNGDGEIDVDEFKVWFRDFFYLNLSYLFVKRAFLEIDLEKIEGIDISEKSKVQLILNLGYDKNKMIQFSQIGSTVELNSESISLDNHKIEIPIEFARNPSNSLLQFKPYYMIIVADPNVGFSLVKKSPSKTVHVDLSSLIHNHEKSQKTDQRLIGNSKQPKLNLIYKLKLSTDNSDDLRKSVLEANSTSFIKRRSNESEKSDGSSNMFDEVDNVDSDEDESFDLKMISSLGINAPGTPSGYGSDDDDLLDDDDILKLSASVMLSNKTPKESNYSVLFNLTDDLVEKSNKMTALIEKHILGSEEINQFLNSDDVTITKLRNAYEVIFNSKFSSKDDFIEKLKQYESDPCPLQKYEI
eukprot:gene12364-6032_t